MAVEMGGFVWRFAVSLLIFCGISNLAAAQDDVNIIIEEAKDVFAFSQIKGGDGSVKVEQTSGRTFLCQSFGTSISVQETYNDQNTIEKVSVFLNGSVAKDITPVHDYQEDQSTFYSDNKRCHFVLPFEKKGMTAGFEFRKTIQNPLYFPPIILADERFPTKKKTIRIVVPDWMTVEFKEMNFDGWDIERSKEQRNGGVVHTFTIRNARALLSESRAPGWSYYFPHILVLPKESKVRGTNITYFKTLADQYAWCKNLLDSIGNDEAPVRQMAGEIVAGKQTDEEKVRAIYDWVHQNIRYIAYEDGIAAFKPKKAQEVLSKKYGDCKGMSNLLVVMLRSLGYDARYCWLGTNHIVYDHSTPSLLADNHMITSWMRDGKPVFLDGTESYIRFGEIAERIQGRQILIENGSGYLLETVPTATYQQNTSSEERVLHIDGTDLVGKVTHVFRGESRQHLLSLLKSVKLHERTDVLRKYLSDNSDAYQISNLATSSLNDYKEDLRVTYDLIHKGALAKFGAENYLDLDNRKRFAAYRIDTGKRLLPICFPYKDHRILKVRIAVPAGARIKSLPGATVVSKPDYGYSGSWIEKEGELCYYSECWLKRTFFRLSEFPGMNRDVQLVQSFYNAQPEITL